MTAAHRIFDALRHAPAGLWTWQLLQIARVTPGSLSRAVRGARALCHPSRTIEIREVDVDTVTTAGPWRSCRYVYGRDYGVGVRPRQNELWRRK